MGTNKPNKQRILEVVSYFFPALSYGGPAKVVYDLSKELSKKNQITVYTTDVWDEERRIKESEKLKNSQNFKVCYFLNIINSLVFSQRFFTGFGMVKKYWQERDSFDIIHIHDLFIFPQILITYIARIFKKPYFISPHAVLDPVRLKRRHFLKKMIFVLMGKGVLSHAEKIIATSDNEAAVLRNLGFDNVAVVYNGISTLKCNPSRKFSKFRKETLTLLYIGKIHPLKGLAELLKALSGAKFNYQLLIAGPDDGGKKKLESEIENLGIKNIYFLGFVDENEKAELFSFTDIFVHPSLSEGFSMSILGALKYSKPVPKTIILLKLWQIRHFTASVPMSSTKRKFLLFLKNFI